MGNAISKIFCGIISAVCIFAAVAVPVFMAGSTAILQGIVAGGLMGFGVNGLMDVVLSPEHEWGPFLFGAGAGALFGSVTGFLTPYIFSPGYSATLSAGRELLEKTIWGCASGAASRLGSNICQNIFAEMGVVKHVEVGSGLGLSCIFGAAGAIFGCAVQGLARVTLPAGDIIKHVQSFASHGNPIALILCSGTLEGALDTLKDLIKKFPLSEFQKKVSDCMKRIADAGIKITSKVVGKATAKAMETAASMDEAAELVCDILRRAVNDHRRVLDELKAEGHLLAELMTLPPGTAVQRLYMSGFQPSKRTYSTLQEQLTKEIDVLAERGIAVNEDEVEILCRYRGSRKVKLQEMYDVSRKGNIVARSFFSDPSTARQCLEMELQSRGEAGLIAKITADQKAFVDQFDALGVDVTRMMVLARKNSNLATQLWSLPGQEHQLQRLYDIAVRHQTSMKGMAEQLLAAQQALLDAHLEVPMPWIDGLVAHLRKPAPAVKPKPQVVAPKPYSIEPKPQEIEPKPQEVMPEPQEVKPKPQQIVPRSLVPQPQELKPKPQEVEPQQIALRPAHPVVKEQKLSVVDQSVKVAVPKLKPVFQYGQ